jgi:hypothetical protein
MEHGEAVEKMIAERYLLDELTAEEREAYEEHVFDCAECAMDLRAGAAFVDAAKAQLPDLAKQTQAEAGSGARKENGKMSLWFAWLRPAIAAPALATLLIILGYQNLVTYSALRSAANQPRLLPWAPLHGATRGAKLSLTATRATGLAIPLDLSPRLGQPTTFSIELRDPKGAHVWSGTAQLSADSDEGPRPVSLVIPGAILQNGSYTIEISTLGSPSESNPSDKYTVEIHLTD